MTVREATAQDWPQIWLVLREVFAAGETFTYDPQMDEPTTRALWMVREPGVVVVAVDGSGAVVGTANSYANRPGPGSHVASASYVVTPAQEGRGAGRALVEHTLEWAQERGFAAMVFNAVAASNARALGLYASLGFTVVGTVPEGFRHPTLGPVGLHVLHRPLTEART